MVGVIVKVADSKVGTVTDSQGRYTLATPADATLEFSYVDYLTQRIAVAGQRTIDVTLQTAPDTQKTLYLIDGVPTTKEEVDQLPPEQIKNMNVMRGVESVVLITTRPKKLEDVVVMSYDKKAAKEDSTSISVYNEGATVIIDEKLKGTTVRVRNIQLDKNGKKGSRSADDPLFVVKFPNGTVQGGGQISDFKPEDIKSISVYKDGKTEQFKQYGDTRNGVIYLELK